MGQASCIYGLLMLRIMHKIGHTLGTKKAKLVITILALLLLMVRPARFELTTLGFVLNPIKSNR
jgi:hypothetical protein